MPHTLSELEQQASELSDEDKIRLANALLTQVNPTDDRIEAIWQQEVNERRTAYLAGELETMSPEDVLRELRSR